MVKALVLIRARPRVRLKEKAKKIDGVKEAFDVTGRFDAVALIEVDELSDIKKAALKIQSIEGVRRTETLIHV